MSDIAINWFEIPVTDIDRAAAFYSTVLDRPMGEIPGPDGEPMQVFMGAEGPSGALSTDGGEPGTIGPTIYLNCPDIDAAVGRVTGAGGKVLQSKTPIGPYGFMAQVQDSEGNRIALHVGTD